MRTIAVMNVKGGVGKTITTVNLATILAEFYNKRVLVVDADPQADTSSFFGHKDEDGSGLCALIEGLSNCYADVVERTNYAGVDLLSCGSELFSVDLEALRQGGMAGSSSIRDLRDNVIEDDAYDMILIDCPPSFTACSIAALSAADGVIIPAKLDAFSVRGMQFLLDQVAELHRVNGRCKVEGVLITQWHNVEVVCQAEQVLRDQGVPVFGSRIRRTDKVDESTWAMQPLQVYSKFSSAGVDYRNFVREWDRMGGLDNG